VNRHHFFLLTLLAAATVSAKDPAPYLVIDLSEGLQATTYPISELDAVPEGEWSEEYKTRKLVLRWIPAGSFVMGAPKEELGHSKLRTDETPHEVTFTQGFYIGVFEITQSQWQRVMGNWPSYFKDVNTRDTRPVEMVSYDHLRKSNSWPTNHDVHKAFYMGRMRARTGRLFDLPTEAQWEYACRAGTTTALNSGENLTGIDGCVKLANLGRFLLNADEEFSPDSGPEAGTAPVGSYQPNAWGLYDTHGNVAEWVLDWDTDGNRAVGRPPNVDPRGEHHAPPGHPGRSGRVVRGGSWGTSAAYTRAASRVSRQSSIRSHYTGFRLVIHPAPK
jgi:formylglycine-generating enzyme required for sulfatase activity